MLYGDTDVFGSPDTLHLCSSACFPMCFMYLFTVTDMMMTDRSRGGV